MNETINFPTSPVTKPKRRRFGTSGFLLITVIILMTGLAITGYLFYQARQELSRLTGPDAQAELAKREVQAVVAKLGKLTLLPSEDPVVATIVDAPFLATQSAFYQHAENGDKLVVYPQAQKAFIFSPNRNIIINAGPLVLDQNEPTPPGTQPGITEGIEAETPSVLASPKLLVSPSPETDIAL